MTIDILMLYLFSIFSITNVTFSELPIRLMHESAIGGHDQWLPRSRSNIGIGNEIVGSFLFVLNSMALFNMEYVM